MSLLDLMRKHGTDKGDRHGYAPLYETVLGGDLSASFWQQSVLEIGIHEGASLRVWRDWMNAPFTETHIVGLDRKRVEVEGCITYQGEQTDSALLAAIAEEHGPFKMIVDDGGHMLAFVRMNGARVLSTHTSRKKAMTAASNRRPTGGLDPANEVKLAIASDGLMTNLLGGLPVIIDGHVIGAVGVGSGTGEQDLEVAKAAVAALPGAQAF
jgi:uncharacterized protein GlcG (DUF336 family)